MREHFRANIGSIIVSVIIMTVIPIALEQWRIAHDERVSNATIYEMQHGDLRQFFRITEPMKASDVPSEDPDMIAQTTFGRFAWRDISSSQVLRLSCVYNGARTIDLRTRAPIKVQIEEGDRVISIAYSLHDFGIDEFIARGLDPKRCEFTWTKEWTLHLAAGIDRIYQVQSNAFRIVNK